jgi:transposase
MILHSKDGTAYHFNIFLYILPYSKYKFITLVFGRNQDTLFECLDDAFENTGGVPQEIWFDNMKQVVDHSKSNFGQAVFNERFKQFSQDAGYHPIACRPFRLQTKGAVEALVRTMDRLRPFDFEFIDGAELINLVDDLCYELNHEVSQATEEIPFYKFECEEKEHLHPALKRPIESFF